MKRICVNLTDEQAVGLKKLAAASGVLQSELIRRAIDAQRKSAFATEEVWLKDAIGAGVISEMEAAKVRSGELPMEAAFEIVRAALPKASAAHPPVLFYANHKMETR